jgi:hypothetical protein
VSAAVLVAFVGLGLLPSAQAATQTITITLGVGGPDRSPASAAPSDTIKFVVSNDRSKHLVKSTSKNWSFSATVDAQGSYSVKLPAGPGTFTYSDTHTVLIGPTVDNGRVTSTAPKPSASATPKPSPSASPKPTPKPSAAPQPSVSPQPTAGASATGTPAPGGSGTALAPGLGTGILTTGTPSPGAPQPNIAPELSATPDATANPAAGATGAPPVKYADRPLTQDSSHRYGLPALLAVLALTGVTSLLVRYLLGQRDPQAPQD